MRKNVASQVVAFQGVSSTDGSAVTTGTPTVYYTIDGGTQGTGTGTATHEGNGQWSYAPVTAETNGDHVAFTFVLTGAISQTVNVYPVSYDPTDSVRMGMTSLPNAAAGAAGGLPTDSTGKTSFNDIAATAIVSGGAINTSSGAVTTVTNNSDMRGTNSALLDSSKPTNWGSMVISVGGGVNALVQGYMDTLLTETTGGRIAGNFDTFFENGDAATTKTVDDVGVAGSGLTAAAVWAYTTRTITAATNITSDGVAINTSSGTVDRVTLTDTTTTNTDMVGTDGANTTTPPTSAEIADAVWDEPSSGHTTFGTYGRIVDDIGQVDFATVDTVTTEVGALENVSTADLAAALVTYDGPTKAEMDSAFTQIKGATWATTDTLEQIRNNVGGAAPTVTQIWAGLDATQLAKFMTVDSGETIGAAGSVAKIAQGAAGGNVTVGAFTQAALAEMVTDDTGQTTAAAGSVALLSQGSGGGDATLAKQDAILAKLAAEVLLSQPVATTGQITGPLVIGDDYYGSRAFAWTISEPSTYLGTESAKFGMAHPKKGSFVATGTIVDNGDGTWTITFEVPRSASADFGEGEYSWSVEVLDQSGYEVTSVRNDGDDNKVDWVEKQT